MLEKMFNRQSLRLEIVNSILTLIDFASIVIAEGSTIIAFVAATFLFKLRFKAVNQAISDVEIDGSFWFS